MWFNEFEWQSALDNALPGSITSEVISKVVSKFLTDTHPEFGCNGRSDYPDLYLATFDYSGLPGFRRQRGTDASSDHASKEKYGAAFKGHPGRPVRVPDGLEIKTCKDQVRVDCHHHHPGMHLVLVYTESDRWYSVSDILVAFLRESDYYVSRLNTGATTRKWSFTGERFVSLLTAVE
jgi:hypothetical protein